MILSRPTPKEMYTLKVTEMTYVWINEHWNVKCNYEQQEFDSDYRAHILHVQAN
jgi:hypothetical protein